MIPKKYFIPVLLLAVLAIAGGAYYVFFDGARESRAPSLTSPTERRAHAYKDPERSIAAIEILAFYAVPRNKVDQLEPDWRVQLETALADAVRFHDLQFKGASRLAYSIFPAPVVLEQDDVFYDTSVTRAGNPHALVNVAEEIGRRAFVASGDLYNEPFAAVRDSGAYRVMGIVYEGVGASGGIIYESPLETASEIANELGVPESRVYIVDIEAVDAFFLVNRREYLSEGKLQMYGSTVLYHEFAHTLGLPDEYDAEGRLFSQDVMGGGRWKPFEHAYVSRDFLRGMGVQ